MGLCPLHADHKPSFLADPCRNLFYCFGCARGGDVIRFTELFHQVKFPQAVALLREWCGVTRLLEEVTDFYRMQLTRHSEALAYLQQRGLHAPEIVEHMRIGYAPGRCFSWRVCSTTRYCGRLASLTSPARWEPIRMRGRFNNCVTVPGRSIWPSIPTSTEAANPQRNGCRAALTLKASLPEASRCRTDTIRTASLFMAAMRDSFSGFWRSLVHDIPANPSAKRRRTQPLSYRRATDWP